MLSKEDLLSAFAAKPIPFEAGGQSCYLLPTTARDMIAARAWGEADESRKNNVYQFLFVRSVCDATGKRFFTDDETAIVENLQAGFVDAVLDRIQEISGRADAKKA